MKRTVFLKALSANDVGVTGTHQAGILIPKTNGELLAFLPHLDAETKNPSAWIECIDEAGAPRRFRFVYYNNRLHEPGGTRNEYRITYTTGYFRDMQAREGDALEISRCEGEPHYRTRLIRQEALQEADREAPPVPATTDDGDGVRIRIRTGWSRVH